MTQSKDYWKEELEKCRTDVKYFIEKYCTVNGEPYKLNLAQREFLNWFNEQPYKEKILYFPKSWI